MRRALLFVPLLLLAGCTDFTDPAQPSASLQVAEAPMTPPGQVPAFQPGVVVARFAPGAPAADIARGQGAQVIRDLGLGMRVLSVPEGRERTVAAALANNPTVLFAELSVPRVLGLPCETASGDCLVPSDEYFGRRWDLHNDGTIRDSNGSPILTQGPVPDADMDWLEAHDFLGGFTQGAIIGVVDTGILPSHEDLSGRLLGQYDPFNIDNIAEDDHGHGTHVSGIILAHADNGVGGAGIAYGPNIRLLMAKGCGNTIIGYICWSPDIASGITWAVDNGASAINLSLGGDTGSDAERTALQYALANDVLPVCAAGNDEGAVDYPAAFPECMAVASTGWDDTPASYTSFGPEVEVAAPGGEILRSDALDRILSTWVTGGYAYLSGTSMAAPQVTGLAGLLYALGVTGAQERRDLIRATADDLGPAGRDSYYGDGRINVWAAVQAATGGPPPPPPPPPDEEAPVAGFTYECTDLDCSFTDTSTDDGGVTQWLWDFGDGTTSPVQDPSHSFPSGGDYTVSLTVWDAGGRSDAVTEVLSVTDPPPPPENQAPVASFTFSCAGMTCSFTDTSTDDNGIVDWLWSFGDGSFSEERHPTYTWAEEGTWTVELLVEDADQELGYAAQDVTAVELPPVLTATGLKVKGKLAVDLSWTGTVKPVDLYRDGSLLASGVPISAIPYRDETGARGKGITFSYVACISGAGTEKCSDPVAVSF